jgi:hypothetical protein
MFLLLSLFMNMAVSAEKIFPYGHPSSNIQIDLKYYNSAATRSAVYTIKSGEIEGDADFVSAPTPQIGRLILNSKITVFNSTAANMHAPYAGQITSTITCNAGKYIREQKFSIKGLSSNLILAVASPRKVFGVCSLDEVGYAGLYFTAYDEAKKHVITVQLFKPVSDLKKLESTQQEIFKTLQTLLN